jgi:hypothetical protein
MALEACEMPAISNESVRRRARSGQGHEVGVNGRVLAEPSIA